MADQSMVGGCTIEILELPGIVCGSSAVAAYEMACVHEHIALNLLCEDCLAVARDGDLVCGRCHDAGHRVAKLLGREVPMIPE